MIRTDTTLDLSQKTKKQFSSYFSKFTTDIFIENSLNPRSSKNKGFYNSWWSQWCLRGNLSWHPDGGHSFVWWSTWQYHIHADQRSSCYVGLQNHVKCRFAQCIEDSHQWPFVSITVSLNFMVSVDKFRMGGPGPTLRQNRNGILRIDLPNATGRSLTTHNAF